MKSMYCSVVLAIALLGVAVPAAAGKLRVVTTTADLAAIVRAVGGEEVEVKAIARGYQDPHYVQAKPSYTRLVNRADLLVYTGLQLEVGWLPLLLQGGRNPRVVPGAGGHLDISEGIRVLEVPTGEVDRTMGDIHPEGNPHYLLDPRNGLIAAGAIAARLGDLAPTHAEMFNRNLERFQEDLRRKIAAWERRIAALRGEQIVAYHKQWEYLVDWLGMEIASYIENRPGIPPSPRHLSALITRMSAKDIRVIICANFVSPAIAERVAEKTGTRVLVLPTAAGGEKGIETYEGLFEMIISHLEGAFAAP